MLRLLFISAFMLTGLWATPDLAPQPQDEFPVYSSYDWVEGNVTGGPSLCPDPAVFRYGTRVVYSYVPIEFNTDVDVAFMWFELDDEGNLVSEDPIAVTEPFVAAEGDYLPFGELSFTSDVSGNVAALMMVNDGEDWVMAAFGIYIIAGPGVEVPEPGDCPLE